eukprot:g23306.t1
MLPCSPGKDSASKLPISAPQRTASCLGNEVPPLDFITEMPDMPLTASESSFCTSSSASSIGTMCCADPESRSLSPFIVPKTHSSAPQTRRRLWRLLLFFIHNSPTDWMQMYFVQCDDVQLPLSFLLPTPPVSLARSKAPVLALIHPPLASSRRRRQQPLSGQDTAAAGGVFAAPWAFRP